MKRVRPAPHRCLVAVTLLLAAGLPSLFGECPPSDTFEILSWLGAARRGAGCAPVLTDPILEQAAGDYAAELAARGVLSHRDRRGADALDRVQAAGGTSTLVGEILGSGLDPREVGPAWAASRSHRAVVENPLWTHVGVGCASLGARRVWVVLLVARRMAELRIERLPGGQGEGGFRVSGRMDPGGARSPVLLSGVVPLEPERWDPESGFFDYRIPADSGLVYHRLGFRDGEGRVSITDVFFPESAATFSPGTAPR
ncbi:MAG: CAP domain-containing protein [Spirochaetales bacterium]|nr:CAP domain-containing protein [Spirochaetales bacterium]